MTDQGKWNEPVIDDFERWSEVANAAIPTILSSPHVPDFRGSARPIELGSLRGSIMGSPEVRSVRSPTTIRRHDPELWQVALVVRGRVGLAQHRNHALLSPGDLAVFDTSHPYEMRVLAEGPPATGVMIHLPMTELPVPDRALRPLEARRLPSGSGMGAVVRQLIRELAAQHGTWGTLAGEHAGLAVLALARAFLADLDGAGDLPSRDRPDTFRYRILAFIEQHLADPQLSPPMIAKAHHISVRYLHHLFREHGQTVSEIVRQRRLERRRLELANPDLPIRAVGARSGFPDPSGFSRTFKAVYGVPPAQYRRLRARRPPGNRSHRLQRRDRRRGSDVVRRDGPWEGCRAGTGAGTGDDHGDDHGDDPGPRAARRPGSGWLGGDRRRRARPARHGRLHRVRTWR